MAALDHIVINTRHDTDAAEALFSALGFTLTPRSHHSLGSFNHLMVIPGVYLEIVGVPTEGLQRQEVLDSPLGLSGIVLQIDDADATFARLQAAGFDPLPPMDLARPVTIDGVEHRAAFRNVRLKPDFFTGGRIYFCQHLTPELVWRPEWMTHPNGFSAIDRVQVESPEPNITAEQFARAFDGRLEAEGDVARVVLEDCDIRVIPGPTQRMRATGLVLRDLDGLVDRAQAAGVSVTQIAPDSVELTLGNPDTTLLCRRAPGPQS